MPPFSDIVTRIGMSNMWKWNVYRCLICTIENNIKPEKFPTSGPILFLWVIKDRSCSYCKIALGRKVLSLWLAQLSRPPGHFLSPSLRPYFSTIIFRIFIILHGDNLWFEKLSHDIACHRMTRILVITNILILVYTYYTRTYGLMDRYI